MPASWSDAGAVPQRVTQRSARHIFLTGRPGIGKTTVLVRLVSLLDTRAVAGFYTRELREGGARVGFQAVTLLGREGILARTNLRSPFRVGRYGVDVTSFESVVLPELARPCEILVVDEIGKMECFSKCFVEAVCRRLDGPARVVATLAASGGGFIAAARSRSDVEIWEVRIDNRDELPRRLADCLGAAA